MRNRPPLSGWRRYIIIRTERTRTTWTFRLALLGLVAATLWLTSGWWTVAVARSLVCEASRAPSDAILVENFEPHYLLFEQARELRRKGLAARVLVPVPLDSGSSTPNAVALGTAELLTRTARLGPIEIVPIQEVEPISLNAARDILQFLERERIRSVIVVAPLFRSRRSASVYAAVFGPAGIKVRCEPVEGPRGVTDWTRTWHGIQTLAEQWAKLQYYRFYVLPFVSQA